MNHVLKLRENDETREIDFEIKFLLSLSTAERFQMMLNKTKEIKELLERKNEYRRTAKIIKRT